MIFSVSSEGIQWTLDFGPDSYYCSKWSRPKFNKQPTRNTPSCLAIAVVSKARFHEKSSPTSANHSEPRGNNGDERRSTFQCGGSRRGHQQLLSIRSRRHRVQLGKLKIGHGRSVQTNHRHPFFSKYICRFVDGGMSWKPHLLNEEEDKENAPPPKTPESVRPTEPPRLQRSHVFGAKLENVPDYVFRHLFQKVLPCLSFKINNN